MHRDPAQGVNHRAWLDQPAERWLVHGVFLLAILLFGPILSVGLFLMIFWAGTPLRDLGMPDLWSFVLPLVLIAVGAATLVRRIRAKRRHR